LASCFSRCLIRSVKSSACRAVFSALSARVEASSLSSSISSRNDVERSFSGIKGMVHPAVLFWGQMGAAFLQYGGLSIGGRHGHDFGCSCQPVARRPAMNFIQLDAQEPAVQLTCGDQGRARTAERIEDDCFWLGESADQNLERLDGLLGRMQAVAGILPVKNVRHGRRGQRRTALASR
jgi:hypothetical protein